MRASGTLARDSSGTCAFYDEAERRCAIHARLGRRALPASCAHFPRRLLIEDDRIAVSLSHYCPTVAGLLFDAAGGAEVVDAPRLLDGFEVEGLDARGAWPPLLRPGVLADALSYRLWERAVVATLAAAEGGPEAALERAGAMTGEVVRWKPVKGRLEGWVAECAAAWQVPPKQERPAPGSWGGFDRAVGRYLAAKAFGNWTAYQGDGFSAVLQSVRRALDVLREEADAAHRPLDRLLLTEALRQADLRLLHFPDA